MVVRMFFGCINVLLGGVCVVLNFKDSECKYFEGIKKNVKILNDKIIDINNYLISIFKLYLIFCIFNFFLLCISIFFV